MALEPIVVEAQGGIEPRAAALLHRIAEAAAKAEGADEAETKRELLERLALILARANSKSISRRSGQQIQASHRGIKRAVEEVTSLEAGSAEMWF